MLTNANSHASNARTTSYLSFHFWETPLLIFLIPGAFSPAIWANTMMGKFSSAPWRAIIDR